MEEDSIGVKDASIVWHINEEGEFQKAPTTASTRNIGRGGHGGIMIAD